MRHLLLAILLLSQDTAVERLIRQLGDADPVRREEVLKKIREMGPSVLEALEKARENPDPEVRARVALLLKHFERERVQTLLEAKERKKLFPRITIDMADAPLDDVLRELSRQSGWIWNSDDLPRIPRTVTLKGKDLPMIEALDRIGLSRSEPIYGKCLLHEEKPASQAVFTDGARFSFKRRPWSPKGEFLGTIYDTNVAEALDSEVHWRVAGIKADRDLSVETCAIHSPGRVYVAGPDLVDPRVIVKGTRFWYCPTPVEFVEPKNGEVWRIGKCQIIIEWPSVRVHLDDSLEERLLTRTLRANDIRYTLKPGVEKDEMGVGVGGGGGGRYGGRFGGNNPAWCGCQDHPAIENPNPPPMSKEHTVRVEFGDRYAVSDLATISITFHKPVEDPFELISPPLK